MGRHPHQTAEVADCRSSWLLCSCFDFLCSQGLEWQKPQVHLLHVPQCVLQIWVVSTCPMTWNSLGGIYFHVRNWIFSDTYVYICIYLYVCVYICKRHYICLANSTYWETMHWLCVVLQWHLMFLCRNSFLTFLRKFMFSEPWILQKKKKIHWKIWKIGRGIIILWEWKLNDRDVTGLKESIAVKSKGRARNTDRRIKG